jgi:hypothetical protein
MMYSTVWNKALRLINFKKSCITLVFLGIGTFICRGQEIINTRPTSSSSRPTATSSSPTNTTTGSNTLRDTSATDTTRAKINTFKTIFKGKPGRAALYSLLVPGGGQIYNKKWFKVPIAWGVDGFLLYTLIKRKNEYNNYKSILEKYASDPTYKDATYSKDQARNFRTAARGNVEYAWVYLALGHIVTVFDAYVDRHLKDFDVSNDLTNTSPYIQPEIAYQPVIALTYRF